MSVLHRIRDRAADATQALAVMLRLSGIRDEAVVVIVGVAFRNVEEAGLTPGALKPVVISTDATEAEILKALEEMRDFVATAETEDRMEKDMGAAVLMVPVGTVDANVRRN